MNDLTETRYTSGYREYYFDNQWSPSVTSIINVAPKPALDRWAKKLTPEQLEAVLEHAKVRGTMIHYNCLQTYTSAFVTQEPPSLEDVQKSLKSQLIQQEIQVGMALFKQFQLTFKLEPTAIERVVYNTEIEYAGRVDFQGYLVSGQKRIPILMDIKTGKEIYKDNTSLQLTAYNKALNDFAEQLYVLTLHPGPATIEGVTFGGRYAYWQFVRLKPDWNGFLEAVERFQQIKGQVRDWTGLDEL